MKTSQKISTIQDLISEFRLLKSRTAIISGDISLSYEEFFLSIKKLSSILCNIEFKKGDRIILMNSNRLASLIGIYSVINVGGVAVPISTKSTKTEIDYVFNDSQSSILVTDETYDYSKLKHNSLKLIISINFSTSSISNKNNIIFFNPFDSHNESIKIPQVLSNDNALILYTSGTSGTKKGVLLTHSNLIKTSKYMNDFMKITHEIREFIAVPLSHAFGFGRTRSVLLAGGTIIVENGKFHPQNNLEIIKKTNCNAISSVSTVFIILLNNYTKILQSIGNKIKWIEIGSMPLSSDYKYKMLQIFPKSRIHMNYGMTEAMRSTMIEFRTEQNKISSVGKHSPNVEIKIMDENENILPPNNTGEIAVKGVNLAKGYWNKKEIWNAQKSNEWFKTDDIGFLDNENYLTLIGRKDDLINVGGEKVHPSEIEHELKNFFHDENYCVCGIDDPFNTFGQVPIICIEGKSVHKIDEIRFFLKDKLSNYKLPREIYYFSELPMTENMKIKRKQIIQMIKNGDIL
jgi:long-chain acyl-CoA synthetase